MHSVRLVVFSLLVSGLPLSEIASAQDPAPSPESLKDAFPAQKHYSPYAGASTPRRSTGATPTCTRACRWTRARSGRG